MTQDDAPTPFHDLDRYLELPRVGGLALSPDGMRLVTTVQTLDAKRTGWTTAVWEVDPTGVAPARRLTRSRKGESSAVFAASGDVLFTSARPDPDADKDAEEPRTALWLLPADGGEARVVATAPGGIGGVVAARAADVVSVAAPVLPGAAGLAEDEKLRQDRTDRKLSAILHAGYPVRHWDHDLGPDEDRRFVGSLGAGEVTTGSAGGEGRLTLRQLTGPGRQLDEHEVDLTPDGTTLVTTWNVADLGAAQRGTLVAIDTATGESRALVDDPDADAFAPAVSADGRWVAYVSETITTPEQSPVVRLGLVSLDSPDADPEILADDWDRWPTSVVWLPDGSGLVVTADEDGRGPVFLLTFGADGPGGQEPVTVERVTADDATFTDVRVAPDGSALYALRTSYAAPSEPVRIDLAAFAATGAAGERTPVAADALRGPSPAPALPGTLTEVETTTADGARVRAWLALPGTAAADAPAPLLLWIHGGPLSTWSAWSWRWNPWLMVARGYAVLLPDPALSTGYGQDFVQRGWGAWGGAPFTDLMAITDAVEALPEVDATRTAAMGGSFGGYMANWVAGHTDRFRAIVTHASLWALDQFGPTTDHAYYWAREMTPEMAEANSPHRFVADIRTPMLVIHGDKDYRVPIGEGLRLWRDLLTESGLPAADDGSTVHRFLYFPDENHWVLAPQHAKVWYQVVLAYLGEHVLDAEPELPAYL
ncbi:S9 family peptidase [Krasilnikoviella flava]|uniref:Dipeptidyl aminopeptidase/acylaminoacyl peptidase n=1 Tax=Krasilnikoviella flava TaxID=526729 RepID=A0A1T5LKM4_9MICO|nr:prolyl oligopeptidase family serine peptidase [Krasilnikoviella flava]SKC76542.1 Dipeptidyl aminopeptidase/acylaminoacyl peptidase [Krasilnikoviella flava]